MRIYEDKGQLLVSAHETRGEERGPSLHVKDKNSAEKNQLKKLIAYARVSTKQQGEGDGLKAQEAAIRAYVLQHGAILHAYHDETASGRDG